jgi:hypothetical protein
MRFVCRCDIDRIRSSNTKQYKCLVKFCVCYDKKRFEINKQEKFVTKDKL